MSLQIVFSVNASMRCRMTRISHHNNTNHIIILSFSHSALHCQGFMIYFLTNCALRIRAIVRMLDSGNIVTGLPVDKARQ